MKGDIDNAGHSYGWGSEIYYKMISLIDLRLIKVINTLSLIQILNDTLVLLSKYSFTYICLQILITADHGGYECCHGQVMDIQFNIPFIAVGPKVISKNTLNNVYVRNVDLPATALYALGIPKPKSWSGNPIVQIFGEEVNNGLSIFLIYV